MSSRQKSGRKRSAPHPFGQSPESNLSKKKKAKTRVTKRKKSTATATATETSPVSITSPTQEYVTQDQLNAHMEQMFNTLLQQTSSQATPPQPHFDIDTNIQDNTRIQQPQDQNTLPPTGTIQLDSDFEFSNPQVNTSEPQLSEIYKETIPVGHHLKSSLKQKIIANEFINDLRSLLPPKPGHVCNSEDLGYSLTKDPSSNNAVLVQNSKSFKSPISTLEWSMAWNIFQAVLCQAHSNQNLSILMAKHCDQVLTLASRGYDWRSYDAGFRWEISAGTVKWGQIHLELLNEAKSGRVTNYSFDRSKISNGSFALSFADRSKAFGLGTCFNLRLKGSCNRFRCPYSHSLSLNQSAIPQQQFLNNSFRPASSSPYSFTNPFRFQSRANQNSFRFQNQSQQSFHSSRGNRRSNRGSKAPNPY